MIRSLWIGLLILPMFSGCAEQSPDPGVPAMQLTSDAFTEGAVIPKQFTADGKNVSPPLAWSGAPAGVQSFALICDDPDAPAKTWVHWVLFNLPAATTQLPEGVPASASLADGGKQGQNDFG